MIEDWQRELHRVTGNSDLSLIASESPTLKLDLDTLIKIVAEETGIAVMLIKSKDRLEHLVFARQIFCFYARKHRKVPLKDVAAFIQKKDHSIVIQSSEVVENMLNQADPDTCHCIKRINRRLAEIQERQKTTHVA